MSRSLPLVLIVSGLLVGLVGGFVWYIGVDDDAALLALAGYLVSAVGGMLTFVGLVAAGVQIGIATSSGRRF